MPSVLIRVTEVQGGKSQRSAMIRRRAFLKAAGLVAAGSFGRAFAVRPQVNHVAIVGAGIIGASIAYYLSRRGCEVTLFDKTGPAAQASGNSFAWLNASWFDRPDGYYDLRKKSLHEYRWLGTELDFPVRWGGSLEWYRSATQQQDLHKGVDRLRSRGEPVAMIGVSDASRLEPRLHAVGNEFAWSRADGAVDSAALTHALVERALAHGARLLAPAMVNAINARAGGVVVTTDAGELAVDTVVVAAGTGANALTRQLGIGVKLLAPATAGIIVTTRPVEPLLNTVCYADDCHFLQLPDGRVVIGEKGGPPKTAAHRAYLAEQPNFYPDDSLAAEHARRVIDAAGTHVPDLVGLQIERVGVGWRPLPIDGLPIIGHIPGNPRIYLASMHSGVTLAPIVGRSVAMEILDGLRLESLADFRVERFL